VKFCENPDCEVHVEVNRNIHCMDVSVNGKLMSRNREKFFIPHCEPIFLCSKCVKAYEFINEKQEKGLVSAQEAQFNC
jgi:hypothetical protein